MGEVRTEITLVNMEDAILGLLWTSKKQDMSDKG